MFANIFKLFQLPEVLVYSIGMAGGVDQNALTRVASHENFVKIYETFDEFEADIASILYATCRITSFEVTKLYSAFLPFHCFLQELTRVEEVSDSCPDF